MPIGTNEIGDPLFTSPEGWGQGSSWPAAATFCASCSPSTIGNVIGGHLYCEVPAYNTTSDQAFYSNSFPTYGAASVQYGMSIYTPALKSGYMYCGVLDQNGDLIDSTANSALYIEKWEVISTTALAASVTTVQFTFGMSGAQSERPGSATEWVAGDYYATDGIPTDPLNNFYYAVNQAGTSGSVEPTWPTTFGQTVTDGSVVWMCAGKTAQLAAFTNPWMWTMEPYA